MRSSSLALFGLSLAFALACGGGDKPAETTTTPPPPPPPTTPANGTATATPTGIGVTECDDYAKKVDECAAKLDATQKAALETSSKTLVDSWKTAAATPEGKATLATTCKTALDSFDCPYVEPKKEHEPLNPRRPGGDVEGGRSRPGGNDRNDRDGGSGGGAGGGRSRPN
ncbi:MAG: hypothetical protein ACOZNI_01550 [Myxococcota bacterium]